MEYALGPEGQVTLAESGRTVPSLIEVSQSEAFLDPSKPPKRARVFLDGIPSIRVLPVISTWPEIEDATGPILENGLYLGQPASEVAERIDRVDAPAVRARGDALSGLRLEGLTKRYGDVEALAPLDLEVGEGELLAVVGPSGCGKTTLLRLIAGLEEPTAGRVFLGERDVTGWRPGRRNVAMVFQSYALFPHLTVEQNIGFGLTVRDVPAAEAGRRVHAAAALVGCTELLARRPHELSGGERQRVALARALVREPALLLLDEPLSNLDTSMRVAVRAELKEIHRRVGATTIHVTHDQVEALVLGDRIAVLNAGVVQQVGAPDEVCGRAAEPFRRDLRRHACHERPPGARATDPRRGAGGGARAGRPPRARLARRQRPAGHRHPHRAGRERGVRPSARLGCVARRPRADGGATRSRARPWRLARSRAPAFLRRERATGRVADERASGPRV